MGPSIGDKQERANQIAEALLGTCDDLPDEVAEDVDLAQLLDGLIWRCETCDWWVEVCETDDDGNCEDCQ